MTKKTKHVPQWIRQLKGSERTRAWAIHLFILYDRGELTDNEDIAYFTKCVERANWPASGLLPRVTPPVAARLGLNDPEWNTWRRFSALHSLLQKVPVLPRKKLLNFN